MVKKKLQRGFSLLEVMVFVTILNIVFVASASFVITSLYRMKINEHKTRATYYAEELQEWLYGEREADWPALLSRSVPAPNSITYCANNRLNLNTVFNDANFPVATNVNCQTDGINGDVPRIFRRRMTLSTVSANQIRAQIEVSWNEISPNGGQTLFTETVDSLYTAY